MGNDTITDHVTYSSVKTSGSRWIENPFKALQLYDISYYPDNVVCLSTSLMTMMMMVAYCTSTDMPVIEQSIQVRINARMAAYAHDAAAAASILCRCLIR